MRRVIGIPVMLVLMLAAVGSAQAASTKDMPSGWWDPATNTFLPMTCDETQVINKNVRKETFHCAYPFPAPDRAIEVATDNPSGIMWASDFDGQLATSFRIRITPSGNVEGSATY
jgi:hypothetical protein